MRSERLIPRAVGQLEWNVACGVSRYLSAVTDAIRCLIGANDKFIRLFQDSRHRIIFGFSSVRKYNDLTEQADRKELNTHNH